MGIERHLQACREGGRGRKKFPGPSSHGGPELSAVLTRGWFPGFELQTTVHKNKFLFMSALLVLLVLVGPYWSWWALGFSLVSPVDKTVLPEL